MRLLRLLFGRRLASSEGAEAKIAVIEGVPAIGLDALSSCAYGPEAALITLAPLGAAGLWYIGPITLGILLLLAALFFSYWQTIGEYPAGGGGYTVSSENLGRNAGLVAAAALMVDYILNVAVGISSGVAALVSAIPVLHAYTLWLCLALLVLLTVLNLRGTREAGLGFAAPTYAFILCLGGALLVGTIKTILAHGHPAPVTAPPAPPAGLEVASAWLLVRSFANGCTATTGVEAVANGVPAFRDPAVVHARRTLAVIVIVLMLLLAGVAFLAPAYRIHAMNQRQPGYETVLSQITEAVAGRGAFYYITLFSVTAVLCLSANTSFVGFPRLCRLVAANDYLPRSFRIPGRRLVYTTGILFLMLTAAALLLLFDGITDRLIPLFAVGAFLAFTMSQAGMVAHWRRRRREARGAGQLRRVSHSIVINGVGTLVTATALAIIVASKFVEGAWISLLAIAVLVLLFRSVKRQYLRMEHELSPASPLALPHLAAPVIVIPIAGWNGLTRKALQFAMRISPDVVAVQLISCEGDEREREAEQLRRQWRTAVEEPAQRAHFRVPTLELLYSPYRTYVEPLVTFVGQLSQKHPHRLIAIAVAELIKSRWWQYLLVDYRAERIRSALLNHGDRRVVVIEIPWYLRADEESLSTGAAAESPAEAQVHPLPGSDAHLRRPPHVG